MKKSWIILLVLIISLFLINFISAEVRINEVMADCSINSKNCEWIELYTSEPLDIINWTIKDGSATQHYNFSATFDNYLILACNATLFNQTYSSDINVIDLKCNNNGWLNNGGDNISLFNNNSELKSSLNYTNSNSEKSWQFCSNSWLERSLTPATENNCSTIQNNPPQNNNNTEQTPNPQIFIEIEFDEDEIINGEEFNIKIKASNLKSQFYNFKLWIKDDDENIISDRYGEDSKGDDKWISGNYLIYNLFKGPGDEQKKVKIKIRDDYSDFSGDANLFFKIEGESEDYENIEILEKEEVVNKNNAEEIKTTTKSSESTNAITGDVIRLGGSESKETNEKNTKNINLIYESKNEKIKLYSIVGFAVLCLGLVILLLFNNLN